MEEEGKDREEEGWGIGIEEGIFLELLFYMFIYVYVHVLHH
jgi:hypothetical protein